MSFKITPLHSIPLPVLNNVELTAITFERLRTLADGCMMSMQALAGLYLADKIESEAAAIANMAEEQRIEETPWIMSGDHTLQIFSALGGLSVADHTLCTRR